MDDFDIFSFDTKANAAIKAEARMISICHDAQILESSRSADVSNVESFQLPDTAKRAGGECTVALLDVLYADHQAPVKNLSWIDTLRQMHETIMGKGFEQVPQLTSSRMIDVNETVEIVKGDGIKRALLIGIKYAGQNGELSGCHNDVLNVKEYLVNIHGFEEKNIIILADDGMHHEPTRDNIIMGYRKLVAESVAGDTVFCHYLGHGGRFRNDNDNEDVGYDETLLPVDFRHAEHIRDDILFHELVHPMAEGVTVTYLMDCYQGGTVLDLPYQFVADGESKVMVRDKRVDFTGFLGAGFWVGSSTAASKAAASSEDPSKSKKSKDDEWCECLIEILAAIFGD